MQLEQLSPLPSAGTAPARGIAASSLPADADSARIARVDAASPNPLAEAPEAPNGGSQPEASVDVARADALLTELLARCFLRPVREFSDQVRTGALHAALADLLSAGSDVTVRQALDDIAAFGDELAHMDPERARLTLEADYNRLFVGPGHLLAPPYESFYTTPGGEDGRGRLRGPAERAVHAFYTENGFAMPEQFVDFPDHIAIELDFLAAMCDKEARLRTAGEGERAEEVRIAADTFRVLHPAQWFGEMKDGIDQGAQTTFYPAAAALVQKVVLL